MHSNSVPIDEHQAIDTSIGNHVIGHLRAGEHSAELSIEVGDTGIRCGLSSDARAVIEPDADLADSCARLVELHERHRVPLSGAVYRFVADQDGDWNSSARYSYRKTD